MRAISNKPLRPVWERKELYDTVLSLRREGLSYNQIIARVLERHGTRIRKSHVSDWVNRKHHPYTSTRQFEVVPSPELAYVVGVVKGDATVDVQEWSYRVRLRVIDKEFVEEFDRCISKVVGSPRHQAKFLVKRNLWSVELSSVLLHRFLIQPFPRIRLLIQHCANCGSAFLRGFFDSEASVCGRSLTVSNTNLHILHFVRSLLSKRGILTTGPRLQKRAGRTVIIKGKAYHANKDQYVLYVRTASLRNYAQDVGFVVKRKQRALAHALDSGT